eukprot:3731744-Rhodomonas_salina.1
MCGTELAYGGGAAAGASIDAAGLLLFMGAVLLAAVYGCDTAIYRCNAAVYGCSALCMAAREGDGATVMVAMLVLSLGMLVLGLHMLLQYWLCSHSTNSAYAATVKVAMLIEEGVPVEDAGTDYAYAARML